MKWFLMGVASFVVGLVFLMWQVSDYNKRITCPAGYAYAPRIDLCIKDAIRPTLRPVP